MILYHNDLSLFYRYLVFLLSSLASYTEEWLSWEVRG